MGAAFRVAIVRHGESTYNREQRFQGRLDVSVLTERGGEQARLTGEALQGITFDAVFASPLKRASQTAETLTTTLGLPTDAQGNRFATHDLLREINLYSWEGLRFAEVRDRFPEQHQQWRHRPQDLEIDGQKPLQDLWQQAQSFWQFLQEQPFPQSDDGQPISRSDDGQPISQSDDGQPINILLVAHSGICRALIATAMGMEMSVYPQLGMNNCSISILNFADGLGRRPQIESLNLTGHIGECLPPTKGGFRLLLVRHGETEWNRQKRFQGQRDIPLNENGERQAQQAGAFLKDQHLDIAFSSPLKRPWATGAAILAANGSAQAVDPPLQMQPVSDLREISHGEWEGLLEEEIEANFPGELAVWQANPEGVQMPGGENLQDVWQRSWAAWQEIAQKTEAYSATATALVVAHDAVNKAIACQVVGLGPDAFWYFKQGNGSVTAIDYPYGSEGAPVLRALNITSHIGGVIDCTAAGAL